MNLGFFLIKSRQKNLNLDFHSQTSRILRQLPLICALGQKLPESLDIQCLAMLAQGKLSTKFAFLPHAHMHLTLFLYAAVMSDIKSDKCFVIKMASIINHDYSDKIGLVKKITVLISNIEIFLNSHLHLKCHSHTCLIITISHVHRVISVFPHLSHFFLTEIFFLILLFLLHYIILLG